MPNLIKMIRDDKDLKRVAYLIAAYRHYLKYKTDDKGQKFEIDEPWLNAEGQKLIDSDDPMRFLGFEPFISTNLKEAPKFVKLYLQFVDDIKSFGAMTVLESIL